MAKTKPSPRTSFGENLAAFGFASSSKLAAEQAAEGFVRGRPGRSTAGPTTRKGGIKPPKPKPKPKPKVTKRGRPRGAPVQPGKVFNIDGRQVSREEFEDERRRRRAEAETGKRPLTFQEAEAVKRRPELTGEIKEELPFRQELVEKTGIGELGEEGIPELAPTPLIFSEFFGDVEGRSSGEIAEAQRRGESFLTPEQNERRKIAGISAVALGLAVGLGIAGVAYVATKFAAGAGLKSVGAMSIYFTGAAGTAGTIFGFGRLTDFERADIEVQKKIIAGIVTSGERYESMTQNGLPTGDTLQGLSILNDNINRAEHIIFDKGNENLKYRNSNEYQEVMQKILDARNAVLRRTDAVINIGTTGSAQLNPELLMLQGEEMLEYAKNPLR